MGDTELRDITLNDVVFAEATPEQRIVAWRLNGVSWAAPMDVDQYVRRETLLSETALSGNGGCKYMILHRKGDPLDIVSSVEATLKTVLISDREGTREAKSYAIASVYTNPVYRERGMAGFMLRKLQELMDQTSEASALYSDIGTVYYARLGWAVYPSLQVALLLDGEVALPEGVKYLSRDEVKPLCEKDSKAVTKEFETTKADGLVHFTFIPSFAQVDWHFTRDGFMAEALVSRTVQHRGAITDDGSAWVYWDHDFREKKLKIIRIVATRPESRVADVAKLLRAAAAEAQDWDLHKVLVWNPSEEVSAAAKAVEDAAGGAVALVFDERLDGSIPSLRWKAGAKPETVWENNDYYSWC